MVDGCTPIQPDHPILCPSSHREGWQGAAAQDYQVRQKQWDTAAADLTAVLGQIGVALGAANDGYQQAEQANAARWR